MLFQITKSIIVTLQIDCNSREEAEAWASKIVATIEDDNGNAILSNDSFDFEAETVSSGLKIVEIIT
jgi:hypothetical protein